MNDLRCRGSIMCYQKLAVIILALLVNACGYHLRGSGSGGLSKELKLVYLDGGSSQFREQFRHVLSSSKGKLSLSAQEAGIIVKIIDENLNRRILSLSSRGRSNEVELDYHVTYDLNKSNKVLLSGQPIQIRRQYFNDQDDIMAKDNEEKVIRNEIYQQAIQNILNRAQSTLTASPN